MLLGATKLANISPTPNKIVCNQKSKMDLIHKYTISYLTGTQALIIPNKCM